MKKLLDFLEVLKDKYKEEYLYNDNWENTSIDTIVSREDKFELAKIIVDEKIKLLYLAFMIDVVTPRPYVRTINAYKEMMKPINVRVAVVLDLLELMIYAEGGERYKRFIEDYKEAKILKDEYTMSNEEYEEYSKNQDFNYF